MRPEVFLDASFAIALSSVKDDFHQRAVLLAQQLQEASTQLVTTRAVILEIGNALSRQSYRSAAVVLLEALELDPAVEIVPVSEQLYWRAFQLYRQRPDKDWGLTDCISFVVMEEKGITEAVTTDEHFRQAGFRVLLREE